MNSEVFFKTKKRLVKALCDCKGSPTTDILGDEEFKTAFINDKCKILQLELLKAAIRLDNAVLMKSFIDYGFSVNYVKSGQEMFEPPLWKTIVEGRYQLAEMLIQAGANVNQRGGPSNFDGNS